jgi:CMP-N-acetylneuraminic acid synthetase
MSVLIVVPARGGSKGLPGKNLRGVAGVSLVARAVFAGRGFAQQAGLDALVFVDTDSPEIAAEGRAWGAAVPFLRPPELAADTTATADSVLHAAQRLIDAGHAIDVIVLLQPTSPLRTADDIRACWEAFDAAAVPSVISTTAIAHPLEISLRADADGVLSWALGEPPADVRRQAFAEALFPSGAVYVITYALLKETKRFVLPRITRGVPLPRRSAIDIDAAADLALADALAKAARPQPMDVGRFTVGGRRCFVVADVVVDGGDAARRAVDSAVGAGADAVSVRGLDALQDVLEIGAYARAAGVELLAAVNAGSDETFLRSLDASAFVVASHELNDEHTTGILASLGRPLFVLADAPIATTANAVLSLRAAGDMPFTVVHAPANDGDVRLDAIAESRSLFGVPSGWRGADVSGDVAVVAVASGADVVFLAAENTLASRVARLRNVERAR